MLPPPGENLSKHGQLAHHMIYAKRVCFVAVHEQAPASNRSGQAIAEERREAVLLQLTSDDAIDEADSALSLGLGLWPVFCCVCVCLRDCCEAKITPGPTWRGLCKHSGQHETAKVLVQGFATLGGVAMIPRPRSNYGSSLLSVGCAVLPGPGNTDRLPHQRGPELER